MKKRRLPMVHETKVLLRHLPGWILYQTALTRTTPEGRPASITYATEEATNGEAVA